MIGSDRELASERDALSGYLEGDTTALELPVDLRLDDRAVPARRPRRAAVGPAG